MLESKYRQSEAAVADRAKMLYEYVDSSIAIYRPNLKLFYQNDQRAKLYKV
jgi:hypothetical protein